MSNIPTPFLITFSENRKKTVLESISYDQRIQLRKETFSKFLFSFFPNFVSCSLLFPLLKLRILTQTEFMISKNADITPNKNSIQYWYKGSFIQTYVLIAKSLSNAIIIERFQYLKRGNSSDDRISRIGNSIKYSLLAALINGIITYPFELSLTRACVLNNPNLKRPGDFLNLKDLTIPIKMMRHYEFFIIYFFENTINGMALITFYSIYNKLNKDNFLSKYFLSFLAALSASAVAYPINTIGKYSQVGGLPNYKTFNIKEISKELLYK